MISNMNIPEKSPKQLSFFIGCPLGSQGFLPLATCCSMDVPLDLEISPPVARAPKIVRY